MSIDMLLVYPWPTKDSPVKLAPLSILFPGTLFEKQGLTVAYHDQRFDSDERLHELIIDSKEIGVSAMTGYQAGQAADILIIAKRINPKIITGVGGPHARLCQSEVLAEPFVDKIWPKRYYGEDLFPFDEQTKIHFKRTDMQYFTSHGCPFSCRFCSLSSPWKPKPLPEIDKELRIIHEEVGFDTISFSDPNMGFEVYHDKNGIRRKINRVERIKEIGKILRDLNVKWDGNMRASYLTPEMVDALVESNCYSLEIGCESGNDYFLRNIVRKGYGVEAIKQAALNIRHHAGLSIMYSFMVHMPRESLKQLNDTFDLIDWIVDTDPNARISIYEYAPYPGTPMYDDAVAGVDDYPKFNPPTTMKGWANLRLMQGPIYWIAGLCFRKDNSRKNFPGEDWKLIEPYIKLAGDKWRRRDFEDFPCEKVDKLIETQVKKSYGKTHFKSIDERER